MGKRNVLRDVVGVQGGGVQQAHLRADLARELFPQGPPTLGGLGRKARARALTGAIAANPRRALELKGARVLLVDDVMTSGATSDACVAALKRAGAGKVVVACFARVLEEALDDAGSWPA